MERLTKARAVSEYAERGGNVAASDARADRNGKRPKPPQEEPRDGEQTNLTDSDSALMSRNKRSEHRQCHSAQAVVDAEGSQLVLGSRVSSCASSRGELVAHVDSMPVALSWPSRALADMDSGYATGTEFTELENWGLDVLVAVGTEDRRRQHEFCPEKPERLAGECKAAQLVRAQDS